MGRKPRLFIGFTSAAEIALARGCAQEVGLESLVWEGGGLLPASSEEPAILLLDTTLPGPNAYEVARACVGLPEVRVVLAAPADRETEAQDLAGFVGAALVLKPIAGRPLAALLAHLSEAEGSPGPEACLGAEPLFEVGRPPSSPESQLVAQLSEPATGLFREAYMRLRLDEEFKRAFRFQVPLSVVLVGMEGPAPPAPEDLILGLAGNFLCETRDIDSLGHWANDRLLLLLPGTSEVGTRAMLQRIFVGLTHLLEVSPGWRVFAGLASYPSALGAQEPETLEAESLEAGPQALLAAAEAAWLRALGCCAVGALTGLAGPGD